MLIVSLTFSKCLATKCVPLIDEPCMVRCTLIDFIPNELTYYWFMIGLDKCSGSCNVLPPKNVFRKKNINVKVFNTITNKSETRAVTKHI